MKILVLTEFIFIFNIFQIMVIVIDAQTAGISGDMLLCSLVDMGANKKKIIKGIKIAEQFLDGSIINKIHFETVRKHGIESTSLSLDLEERTEERKGTEISQCISKTLEKISVSSEAKKFAISSVNSLIEAESKIHGESIDSVHFHEASSIDTVIDIVGTAIALDDLQFFAQEIISSPVAIGGGSLNFSHGITSNPAHAILEIFKESGIKILGGPIKEELTTPTGASMLVNLSSSCNEFYPFMEIDSIGYGAGKKEFKEFANVLKIVQGKKIRKYEQDWVKIIETNVDDVTGEILGFLIEKLMKNGAKDVSVYSGITKKGRPTNLLSIICDAGSMNSLIDILISETGSLGVRIRNIQRIIIPRSVKRIPVQINNRNFTVQLKMLESHPNNFKIEFDDIKFVSNELGKTFKQTEELIKKEIKKNLTKNEEV